MHSHGDGACGGTKGVPPVFHHLAYDGARTLVNSQRVNCESARSHGLGGGDVQRAGPASSEARSAKVRSAPDVLFAEGLLQLDEPKRFDAAG